MPRQTYHTSPYILNAGNLGWLEGSTLSVEESNPSSSCIHYFGGVPYALPPVGPYRFQQARPLPSQYRYGTKASPGRFASKAAVCPQPAFGREPDPTLWDENCLHLNVYIPAGEQGVPEKGWPVFFYCHGGFLQWGTPNFGPQYIAPLLKDSAFKAIIVCPAYRLNVFGFLASHELKAEAQELGQPFGNQGFWDQRLALEWTAANISAFGGDPENVTIGGYSAGAHSSFQQLAHELYFVPDEKAIIKRAIMWSNSPGVQPKSLVELQKQFDELLEGLQISSSLFAADKLQQLRAKSPMDIVRANNKMKLSEFRAVTDGQFIANDLFANINSGDFGRRMKKRGIKLMNGECRDEHALYETWRTPPPSFDAVYTRLCADYPEYAVQKLTQEYCGERHTLPAGSRDWQDSFGRLYANMQVHCLERGFHRALVRGGIVPGEELLRYRFNWKTSGCSTAYPPEWGVTHGTDMAIWFFGLDQGNGLTEEEKKIVEPWNDAFAAFVRGDVVEWGTSSIKEMLRLREDGETDVWEDDRWEEGVNLWDAINGQNATGLLGWTRSKL